MAKTHKVQKCFENGLLDKNLQLNLGGICQVLRIATVKGKDCLWVPLDKAGLSCKVVRNPDQQQYVESVCALLYKDSELSTALRILPSYASRIINNNAHVPAYLLEKIDHDSDIAKTISNTFEMRMLTCFSKEQRELFWQLLRQLILRLEPGRNIRYLRQYLALEYSNEEPSDVKQYCDAIAATILEGFRQENMKADPVPLPAWRYKPKDIYHDDPYSLSTEHSNSTALTFEMIEDTPESDIRSGFGYERVVEFVERNSAVISKIDCSVGKIKIFYKVGSGHYKLHRLEATDYQRASDFIYNHLSEFRPKVSWRGRLLSSMALTGLSSEKWTAYVFENTEGNIVAYLDFKIRTDGNIELGIQLTAESERGKHLATGLINYLRLKYMHARFFTGTFEQNKEMRATLKITGFREYFFRDRSDRSKGKNKKANRILERINPEAPNDVSQMTCSIYYYAISILEETLLGAERKQDMNKH